MLSSSNIERLIAVKRREIEKEKTVLGLSPPQETVLENVSENKVSTKVQTKQVNFAEHRAPSVENDFAENQKEKVHRETSHEELDERIPPDLERYIRRYIGLPVMLKAGEYSPNNPLVRAERAAAGDALLGLGEYERRRNTLRKIRQQQYREYLDQQAKKKQEAKEQAERERREREQKEKEREEREREILEERERYSAEHRRSLQHVPETISYPTNKVDTGVQVDGFSCPLSVAVQTDDKEMYRLRASPSHSQLTQAERELSPRSVHEPHWGQRRRSYGDFDERTSPLLKKSNRDKLTSDLRHTYMPSIFDADAIRLRNMQAEKEAAERRQFYQQELKNQILEQQRIREERKTREKMLEQAEMRRLEEQLRMLRVAQDRERDKHHVLTAAMNESTKDYISKRTELQKEIDCEQRNLRAATQSNSQVRRNTNTSRSDTNPSKLPFYYPRVLERNNEICEKKPYSINIPDHSIFSANYDVDTYLRRNLNFNKERHISTYDNNNDIVKDFEPNKNVVIEKAIVHDRTEERLKIADRSGEQQKIADRSGEQQKIADRPEWRHKIVDRPDEKVADINPSYAENVDTLPIPVLRHSPKRLREVKDEDTMSEAMKKVDDKWKVPAVQKNILKALPNDEGKSVNILTQLGSIRRQLQLEQLKLDKMTKDDV